MAAIARDSGLRGLGLASECLALIGGPSCRTPEHAAVVATWLWQVAKLLGFAAAIYHEDMRHYGQINQNFDRSHHTRALNALGRQFVAAALEAVQSGNWSPVKMTGEPPKNINGWNPPEPTEMSGAAGWTIARAIEGAGLSEEMATLWQLHLEKEQPPKTGKALLAVLAQKQEASAAQIAEGEAAAEINEETTPTNAADAESAAFLDEIEATPNR